MAYRIRRQRIFRGRPAPRRRNRRRLPGRLRARRTARLTASPKRCGYRL